MKTCKTLAVLAAACLTASAHADDTLPAGILITGQVSGASTQLYGLDFLSGDDTASNITRLSATEIEFISADGALQVDFFTDGRIQVWNNTGDLALPGRYTLSFSFAGLTQPLAALAPVDVTALSSGSYSFVLTGPDTVSLTLDNLSFTSQWGILTAQVTAAAVPEPASLALFGAGLGLLALRRTRRSA
ncbi:PEP-CTERM sorting domain-containing protein [Roseateles puraquae]|uniref:Ice-binding protein C-terminal domain-containing protein n=1 Tax=Roseateles puraquae TaxID=431059 RepID=A0A254NCM5_9BURK|nr:PEP-CTERM sorting domain-containing protein [Roseateles puraquae]MDG0853538.1 PEP-CTERM sorting domain-containing protein [Roseateles puraquae]OWR05711.1 hypothetical protein CDO81_04475 [Roseateles puraquae]